MRIHNIFWNLIGSGVNLVLSFLLLYICANPYSHQRCDPASILLIKTLKYHPLLSSS